MNFQALVDIGHGILTDVSGVFTHLTNGVVTTNFSILGIINSYTSTGKISLVVNPPLLLDPSIGY